MDGAAQSPLTLKNWQDYNKFDPLIFELSACINSGVI
jgi:hypothetical protein